MAQSSLLGQYEQHYASLVAEVTIQIGQLGLLKNSNENSNNIKQISESIDSGLLEANELLEQMNLEIHDLDSTAQRTNAISRLNCAVVELQRLQSEYQKTKTALRNIVKNNAITASQGRDGIEKPTIAEDPLHESISCSDYLYGEDQKQRLLENSERIERAGHRLQEGYRVILETESLGTQVLNDLYHQRETIQGARGRLRETNADLGRASRTLNSMLLRIWREKIVLYGMIVCFVLAVIISLYLTLSSSSPSPEPTNS